MIVKPFCSSPNSNSQSCWSLTLGAHAQRGLRVVVLCVCVCVCVCPRPSSATRATKRQSRHTGCLSIVLASVYKRRFSYNGFVSEIAIAFRYYARGGHSYSTRRTVRDRGQDAVKRSSRIFSTGQAVKRTFWVGQRSRPTFAQTNSYSNSYPTGYTHDFVYTVYLSRLTSQLPAHALGLTFHSFWNRTPSFIMYGL